MSSKKIDKLPIDFTSPAALAKISSTVLNTAISTATIFPHTITYSSNKIICFAK